MDKCRNIKYNIRENQVLNYREFIEEMENIVNENVVNNFDINNVYNNNIDINSVDSIFINTPQSSPNKNTLFQSENHIYECPNAPQRINQNKKYSIFTLINGVKRKLFDNNGENIESTDDESDIDENNVRENNVHEISIHETSIHENNVDINNENTDINQNIQETTPVISINNNSDVNVIVDLVRIRETSNSHNQNTEDKMITTISTKKRKIEIKEVFDCAICYDELMEGTKNTVVTQCGHKFCLTCLLETLKRNNECPICRTAIEEKKRQSNPQMIYPGEVTNIIRENLFQNNILEDLQNISKSNRPESALRAILFTFSLYVVNDMIDLMYDGDIPREWQEYNIHDEINSYNEDNDYDSNEDDSEDDNDSEHDNDSQDDSDSEDENQHNIEHENQYDSEDEESNETNENEREEFNESDNEDLEDDYDSDEEDNSSLDDDYDININDEENPEDDEYRLQINNYIQERKKQTTQQSTEQMTTQMTTQIETGDLFRKAKHILEFSKLKMAQINSKGYNHKIYFNDKELHTIIAVIQDETIVPLHEFFKDNGILDIYEIINFNTTIKCIEDLYNPIKYIQEYNNLFSNNSSQSIESIFTEKIEEKYEELHKITITLFKYSYSYMIKLIDILLNENNKYNIESNKNSKDDIKYTFNYILEILCDFKVSCDNYICFTNKYLNHDSIKEYEIINYVNNMKDIINTNTN